MKSVFHIALCGPSGYSNKGLMDGFLSAGFVDYRLFDFQLQRFQYGKEKMEEMLIEEAKKMKPDLIFIQAQGSDVFTFATFRTLSKIGFTVNYTFDIRSKEQTEWLYALAPHLGLICFSNQRDVDECNSRGYKNVMCLQSSADPDIYKPDETKERKGVVFIGNNFMNTNMQFPLSKERAEMVEFLQKEFPNEFTVYGNNWGGGKLVGQKEEVEIYQSAAIAIAQNNFMATDYHSDRIWRAMFCGAMCLTPYYKGIERLFSVGVHLDCWNSLDELRDKIDFYLKNPKIASEIGTKGLNHVMGRP